MNVCASNQYIHLPIHKWSFIAPSTLLTPLPPPPLPQQRVYAVLVMVIGVLAYGYIIASVAASLANADSARAQYQDKLKGIKAYMEVRCTVVCVPVHMYICVHMYVYKNMCATYGSFMSSIANMHSTSMLSARAITIQGNAIVTSHYHCV